MTNAKRYLGQFNHGWLMIACCIPMLLIAVLLVAIRIITSATISTAPQVEHRSLYR